MSFKSIKVITTDFTTLGVKINQRLIDVICINAMHERQVF